MTIKAGEQVSESECALPLTAKKPTFVTSNTHCEPRELFIEEHVMCSRQKKKKKSHRDTIKSLPSSRRLASLTSHGTERVRPSSSLSSKTNKQK